MVFVQIPLSYDHAYFISFSTICFIYLFLSVTMSFLPKVISLRTDILSILFISASPEIETMPYHLVGHQ